MNSVNTVSSGVEHSSKIANMIDMCVDALVNTLEVTTTSIQQAAETAIKGLQDGTQYLYTDVIVKNLMLFGDLMKNINKNGMDMQSIEHIRGQLFHILNTNPYVKNFAYLLS